MEINVKRIKTEEENEKENEMLYSMFPDAKFVISIDIEKIDDLLSEKKEIIIQQSYKCYCHYFNITKKIFTIRGDKLTNKYVIDQLIKQGLESDCNHMVLDSFHNIGGNLYEIFFGM